MPDVYAHPLDGCTPTPLASYLKALAVLRLVSSPENNVKGKAADPAARGWWANERFYLRTHLDRDALLCFFLEEYAPSPIIAPWNGRAGFLEGEAGADSGRTGALLMKAIEESSAERLRNMRAIIAALRQDPMLIQYDKLRALAKAAGAREKRASELAEAARRKRKPQLQEKLLAAAKHANGQKKEYGKSAEATKSALLPTLRSSADPRHLRFIDACFVLADEEQAAPLLGSGGNDGSRDFGMNFAEALEALFDFVTGAPKPDAGEELPASLFSSSQLLQTKGSIGQFGPGQGGPNGSTGYDGWNALNRWDVLLTLEGTLLFAGVLTRRWEAGSTGRASFPFTFEANRAGSGALSTEDPTAPRGEIWTPLWSKPSNLAEVEALISEGRLTVGRASARTGLDAARAVARLGLSRGVAAFERYSLVQPDKKMPYQATPLGRFVTPEAPRRDPVADLDRGGWLARLRSAAGQNAPARARSAIRKLDDALFDIARAGAQASTVQSALIALGDVVAWLAASREGRESVGPPPLLGREWLHESDDGSPEFRVAAALASLGWPERHAAGDAHANADAEAEEDGAADTKAASEAREPAAAGDNRNRPAATAAPPMAAHFAPVAEDGIARRVRHWAESDPPTVIWGAGGLVQNMIRALDRRLVERALRGLGDKPLAGTAPAQLVDVAAFLDGPFDDARCAALLAGLVWAHPTRLRPTDGVASVPFAYAVLKPLFTPDAQLKADRSAQVPTRQYLPEKGVLPIPPSVLARLRRGAIDEALLEALRRARASGLRSPFEATHHAGAAIDPARLAAALLVPIDEPTLNHLMQRAYPLDERQEETDDAA